MTTDILTPSQTGNHQPEPASDTPKPPLRQRLFGAGGLTFPAWAYLVFFFVIPLALVVWYSFGYKPDQFTTYATDRLSLDNYGEAFGADYRSTFTNTLQIAIVGVVLTLLIGIPFAYWLAVKSNPRRRPLYLALIIVPFFTNFLVRTIGWQITLAPSGWLSSAMQSAGFGELGILYTRAAVQIGVVYNYLPLMIFPLYVAMDRAGLSLREASRDLGANRWTTFFRITLPLAAPGIASGVLLVFIPLMGDYVTPSVLGGAKGTMAGQMIAAQFETAQNWALGSAMTVSLMLVVLICVVIAGVVVRAVVTLLDRRVFNVPEVDTAGEKPGPLAPLTMKPMRTQRDWYTFAIKAWAVIVYLFLFLPIAVIVVYSFNTGRLLQQFESFGFTAYSDAVTNDTIVRSVQVSLEVGVLSALLATVLGGFAGIGIGISRRPRWWSIGLLGLLTVTLVTPDIADAVAFLPWYVTLGVDGGLSPFNNGLFRLVISHAVVSMVVVTFIVRARVASLDPALEEAAADLYAPPLERLRHVILPAAMPGIIAGMLLAFTFSLDDVVISTFVQQPGYTPWPVYVFSNVRVALRPEVAAMSTLMLALTLAVLAISAVILRRSGEDSSSMVKMLG
ncbi:MULTISPECIES: ABC transporter permease subunit [Gordonia]|uniref:Putative spermidine/putrescine ABC transporter permease protein n=1 Tax=Gordonia sputi NBRC 100414 TaxID=1089453 RepID=H5TV86_9ACTN|nr:MULTISPECIES: ABC transporter permease subunit [Gordonia]OBA31624.1 spermidine/putrescine ABC transporter permease [Gordonia sp. 852002-51296_SCH5728562-b]OBC07164.1 spermidine/putrescine ABC transporter permease [Gordonia sp. 852002-50395_SCH5434458]GAB37394.1 putative spermidine/putrescine ABC transporter permease protein [Gordonia sputi NBRC 100414]